MSKNQEDKDDILLYKAGKIGKVHSSDYFLRSNEVVVLLLHGQGVHLVHHTRTTERQHEEMESRSLLI